MGSTNRYSSSTPREKKPLNLSTFTGVVQPLGQGSTYYVWSGKEVTVHEYNNRYRLLAERSRSAYYYHAARRDAEELHLS